MQIQTFSAIVARRTGGPDVLELVRQTRATPDPEAVEVEVELAGINYLDVYLRRGDHPASRGGGSGGR